MNERWTQWNVSVIAHLVFRDGITMTNTQVDDSTLYCMNSDMTDIIHQLTVAQSLACDFQHTYADALEKLDITRHFDKAYVDAITSAIDCKYVLGKIIDALGKESE